MTIELEEQEVQFILAVLAKQPIESCLDLFTKMRQQYAAETQPQPVAMMDKAKKKLKNDG